MYYEQAHLGRAQAASIALTWTASLHIAPCEFAASSLLLSLGHGWWLLHRSVPHLPMHRPHHACVGAQGDGHQEDGRDSVAGVGVVHT